jgi:hypothetical protein
MPGAFKVFLSHAEEDRKLVYRVWSILHRLKVRSYMHERYPNYSQDIPTGIRDVLKNKNCVMCITFLTRNGINSQWVQQELGVAYAFDRIIVPVVQKGVEYKGFVQMVTKIPYQPKSPDGMIHSVIYAVRSHVIKTYGAVKDGLALTCPSDHEHDYTLPSNGQINRFIKAHRVFTFTCPTCKTKMRVSPRTLEIVP